MLRTELLQDPSLDKLKWNHIVVWHAILAIFQKYAICSILAYPFKPQPLKNVPNHDMVPLHAFSGVVQVGELGLPEAPQEVLS